MKLSTNKLMGRGAGGRFTGLSARAATLKLRYEVKVDARLQRQLEQIEDKLKDNVVYSLKGAAYELTQFAKASIVRTKAGRWGASRPGSAPHTRGKRNNLRAAIWYEVDKEKESAVIGPRFSKVAKVGRVHEFGGRRRGKRGTATYPKRPFMQPALQRTLPRIPRKFKNILSGPGT